MTSTNARQHTKPNTSKKKTKISSRRSRIASWKRMYGTARSAGDSFAHAVCAARARSNAVATSSALETGSSTRGAPVNGVGTEVVAPLDTTRPVSRSMTAGTGGPVTLPATGSAAVELMGGSLERRSGYGYRSVTETSVLRSRTHLKRYFGWFKQGPDSSKFHFYWCTLRKPCIPVLEG